MNLCLDVLIFLAHHTVPSNTSSICVPFVSRWTWCAILHFAKSVVNVALSSKTHTSALVYSSS